MLPADLNDVFAIAPNCVWPRQAWREKQLFQHVLVGLEGAQSSEQSSHKPSSVKSQVPRTLVGSTFVVTGGLGALGFEAVRWLAEAGVARIVLLARSEATAERREAIQHLQHRTQAEIKLCRCDVNRLSDLRATLHSLKTGLGKVDGVVHAAGKAAMKRLRELTIEDLQDALQNGGSLGAWNLHEALQGWNIQHFLMFSSSAMVLPMEGQASYAAGKAGMDQLAQLRMQRKLAATVIDFGLWEEVGVGRHGFGQRLTPGMGSLSNDTALRVLSFSLEKRHAPCLKFCHKVHTRIRAVEKCIETLLKHVCPRCVRRLS